MVLLYLNSMWLRQDITVSTYVNIINIGLLSLSVALLRQWLR